MLLFRWWSPGFLNHHMGPIFSTKNLAFADAMDDHGRDCGGRDALLFFWFEWDMFSWKVQIYLPKSLSSTKHLEILLNFILQNSRGQRKFSKVSNKKTKGWAITSANIFRVRRPWLPFFGMASWCEVPVDVLCSHVPWPLSGKTPPSFWRLLWRFSKVRGSQGKKGSQIHRKLGIWLWAFGVRDVFLNSKLGMMIACKRGR